MAVTLITTAQGRVIEAAMGYEDATTFLRARTMSRDDGMRELVRVDGTRATVNIGAIVAIEETVVAERTVGFR